MAIQHDSLPIFGVQFHPESFLTPMGSKILMNFLNYKNDRIGG
jgi:anthranilate synthase component 2